MKKIRRSLAVFIAAFVMITGAGLLTGKTVPVRAEDNVTAFVDRMYQVCLGRAADEEGRADWVNRLQTGEARGADVAYGFVFSTEFRYEPLQQLLGGRHVSGVFRTHGR